MKCEVVGDPNPTVSWLRDNLKVCRYSRDASEFRERRSGSECLLEIRQAKLDFTGTYTAVASNIHGEALARINIQVFTHGTVTACPLCAGPSETPGSSQESL